MVSNRARANSTVGTRLAAVQEGMANLEARTRTAAPDGSDERLEAVERRLDLLSSAHYRADEDLLVRGSDYAQALLDPAYIGPGPARVTFLPSGTLSTDYYEWRGDYYPWGNRVVNMIRIDGRWLIDGHSGQGRDFITGEGRGGIVKLALNNGWKNYSEYTGSYQYTEAQVQRLSSGIVSLSGLVGMGTVTAGTNVTVLPEGYRPDNEMIFPTLNGNNYRALTVSPDGRVDVRGGHVTTYISLDGISFPAAGVAQWTEIGAAGSGSSFANGWAGLPSSTLGTPAYWKDPYGLVWFRGLLTGGTRTTDNLMMVQLPTTHRSTLQQHHTTSADDQYGLVSSYSSTGLAYKSGTYGASWISLAPITIMTDEALATGVWSEPVLKSSWSNYDPTQFPALGVTRRPDGLGLSKGLIRLGTVGATTAAANLPPSIVPAMTSLRPISAVAAAGRLDIYGHRGFSYANTIPGQMTINFGNAGWVSLDGLKWMVGEL